MTEFSDRPITEAGIWLHKRMKPMNAPRPALFMDRDDVIVSDTGYLSDPSSVTLIPGMAALIKRVNDAGVPVLVVTNQSGIDRGLLNWEDFANVEAQIASLLGEEGAATDATAACPFHPEHTVGYGAQQARWRKPGPGMIVALGEALSIDLSRSCLIGDKTHDLEAARAAGLAGGFLFADTSDPKIAGYGDRVASTGFRAECGDTIAQVGDWLARTPLFLST